MQPLHCHRKRTRKKTKSEEEEDEEEGKLGSRKLEGEENGAKVGGKAEND